MPTLCSTRFGTLRSNCKSRKRLSLRLPLQVAYEVFHQTLNSNLKFSASRASPQRILRHRPDKGRPKVLAHPQYSGGLQNHLVAGEGHRKKQMALLYPCGLVVVWRLPAGLWHFAHKTGAPLPKGNTCSPLKVLFDSFWGLRKKSLRRPRTPFFLRRSFRPVRGLYLPRSEARQRL